VHESVAPSVLALRRTECPLCLAVPIEMAYSQPALFRHGGYGEATRTTLEMCLCRIRESRREADRG
jgi:hypothetical protein